MDDYEHMPENVKQLLVMQAMREGKPVPAHFMGPPGQPVSYGTGSMMMGGDANSSGKVGKSSRHSMQDHN